jgi:DNA (cytosine-5)-methyltransferase 1
MDRLKVVETFAGIGSQRRALELANVDHEVVGISEWNFNSLLSYDAIHTDDGVDYSEGMSYDEIFEILNKHTFSHDGSKPYDLSKMTEDKIRKVYNAHIRTKNLGNITELRELPYCDLLTYSFPCKDISIAGRMAGMTKGENTRSGLLWEIERLLDNANTKNKLPKYLLLENVKNLVGKKFKEDFDAWIEKLDELGYNTYWDVLNARDFGLPQRRNRVFAVSILKDYDDGTFFFEDGSDKQTGFNEVMLDDVDEKFYIEPKEVNRLIGMEKLGDIGTLPSFKGIALTTSALASREHRSGGWTEVVGTLCARDWKDPKVVAVPITKQNEQYKIKTDYCEPFAIRKIVPQETFRLTGFTDEDFLNASKVCANTHPYSQTGDSIAVPVLVSIFKNLFKGE